jgi:endogenous inhibitor of DNA gyrase (YacG/DUF329 family)
MMKVLCPICQAVMVGQSPSDWPYFPFCSQRCKTIDLGRWLDERYRVPGEGRAERTDSEEDDVP